MTPWAKSNSTYSNPIGGSLAQRSRTKSHGTASAAEGWGSLLAVNDAAAIVKQSIKRYDEVTIRKAKLILDGMGSTKP